MKKILVIFYGLSLLIVLSIIHTWHFVDLAPVDKIPERIAILEEVSRNENLKILHVLGEGCGCSDFTAEYLYKRGAKKRIREIVYYFGTPKDLKLNLKSKGFEVFFKNVDDLTAKGKVLSGVPFFQVYNKKKELLFSGGYSKKMVTRGTKFQDLNILDQVIHDGFAKVNPILGCAVGKTFTNLIDPLGLKY